MTKCQICGENSRSSIICKRCENLESAGVIEKCSKCGKWIDGGTKCFCGMSIAEINDYKSTDCLDEELVEYKAPEEHKHIEKKSHAGLFIFIIASISITLLTITIISILI